MDNKIAVREKAVIDAARANGNAHVIDIHGAVDHQGDPLEEMHLDAIGHLKESGLPWTIVSPNSVMETSFLSLAEMAPMKLILGMSGHGKVGLVALDDVARVMATVVTGEGHEGQEYMCTGPEAVDMPTVVRALSEAVGHKIEYIDLPEEEFAKVLLEHGGFDDRETLEINVLCHLRAWRNGKASLVTDTVEKVTGRPAMSVEEWFAANKSRFDRKAGIGEKFGGLAMRSQYSKYKMEPQ